MATRLFSDQSMARTPSRTPACQRPVSFRGLTPELRSSLLRALGERISAWLERDYLNSETIHKQEMPGVSREAAAVGSILSLRWVPTRLLLHAPKWPLDTESPQRSHDASNRTDAPHAAWRQFLAQIFATVN